MKGGESNGKVEKETREVKYAYTRGKGGKRKGIGKRMGSGKEKKE